MKQVMHMLWMLGLLSLILSAWMPEFLWQYIVTGVIMLFASAVVHVQTTPEKTKK